MRSFSVIAVCVAAGLLLAACGGESSSKEAAPPSTPAVSNIKEQKTPQSSQKLSGQAAQPQGAALAQSGGQTIALRQLKQSLARLPLGQLKSSLGPQTLDALPGEAAQKPAGTPLQHSQGPAPALRALSQEVRFAPTKTGSKLHAAPQTTEGLGGIAQTAAGSLQSAIPESAALGRLANVVKALLASPQRQAQINETGSLEGAATAPAGALSQQTLRPAPAFKGLGQAVAGLSKGQKASRKAKPQTAESLSGLAAQGTGQATQGATPNSLTGQLGQAAGRIEGVKKQATNQSAERLPGQAAQAPSGSQPQSKPAAQVNLNSLRP